MDKEILQELCLKGLSTHKISKELKKGQTTVRYWLKKYNLKTNTIPESGFCVQCNVTLKGNQQKFCSKKCKSKFNNTKQYNLLTYKYQQMRAKDRKLDLLELKGNCCSSCGYNKNYSALHFHHVNPLDKKFNLDARSISNKKWEYCLTEAEKCIILCANCHSELHNPTCIF